MADMRFNNFIQQKCIYTHSLRFTATQYNERPGWTCEISASPNVSIPDIVGVGVSTDKASAKRKACESFFANLAEKNLFKE